MRRTAETLMLLLKIVMRAMHERLNNDKPGNYFQFCLCFLYTQDDQQQKGYHLCWNQNCNYTEFTISLNVNSNCLHHF